MLHEVCSDGEVIAHHSNHDLLRECKGCVTDSLKDDVVERMVAALEEEGGDKDEKKRDGCDGCDLDVFKSAMLLDFMMVFGMKAKVFTVLHHSDMENQPSEIEGETINAATLFILVAKGTVARLSDRAVDRLSEGGGKAH